MSTNIVLPSLSKWTENHISAIYQANSQTSNALNNFLSKDAVITVNGKKISHTELAKEFQNEKYLEAAAFVTFANIVEVPADKTSPILVIYLYFRLYFDYIDNCYDRRSGWDSWNFLHR